MTPEEMDDKIEALCKESSEKGNFKMVVMCLLALAGESTYRQATEDIIKNEFE